VPIAQGLGDGRQSAPSATSIEAAFDSLNHRVVIGRSVVALFGRRAMMLGRVHPPSPCRGTIGVAAGTLPPCQAIEATQHGSSDGRVEVVRHELVESCHVRDPKRRRRGLGSKTLAVAKSLPERKH
jgi:hypothetical protein